MADSKDNESFFRKVARFVANPTTDWSEINSRQDDPESDLAIAYRGLAFAALVWCIWSWRTESPIPAAIATLFTGLANVIVLWMMI